MQGQSASAIAERFIACAPQWKPEHGDLILTRRLSCAEGGCQRPTDVLCHVPMQREDNRFRGAGQMLAVGIISQLVDTFVSPYQCHDVDVRRQPSSRQENPCCCTASGTDQGAVITTARAALSARRQGALRPRQGMGCVDAMAASLQSPCGKCVHSTMAIDRPFADLNLRP
jgi:hypothetical protein